MGFQKISYEENEGVAEIGLGLGSQKSLTILDEETLKELSSAIEEVKKKKEILRVYCFFLTIRNVFRPVLILTSFPSVRQKVKLQMAQKRANLSLIKLKICLFQLWHAFMALVWEEDLNWRSLVKAL